MKFLILHGSFGSPNANWFPWLKDGLEAVGQSVLVPQMPIDNKDLLWVNPDYMEPREQYLDNWLKFFAENIQPKLTGEGLAVIGHSISSVFILHLCEKLNLKVDLGVFVAPFLELPPIAPAYDLVNASFYNKSFDFEKIRGLINNSYVLYSENDQYVPIENASEFADRINASKVFVLGGGHMYEGTGFTKFPLILELCKSHVGLARE